MVAGVLGEDITPGKVGQALSGPAVDEIDMSQLMTTEQLTAKLMEINELYKQDKRKNKKRAMKEKKPELKVSTKKAVQLNNIRRFPITCTRMNGTLSSVWRMKFVSLSPTMRMSWQPSTNDSFKL